MWAEPAHQRHEPSGRLLQRCGGEAAVRQRFAVGGQPGVGEAQEPLPDTEDLAGGGHLGAPDLGEVVAHAGPVHGGVEHRAAFAAGAGDHQDVHALGGVLGECRRAIARLVVGMGVDAHQDGFEAVTIAEIAAAAQVAKMTVTNYFPRKEDLALDFHETFTASLARTVASRREGESALAALRREYLAAVERHDAVAGFSSPAFAQMIAASPTLNARLRELHDQREDTLAHVLATETGAAPGDLTPRAAAALLAAAHRTLFQHVMDLVVAGQTHQQIATTMSRAAGQVFGLLEPSLAHYAVRQARR
ncbi:hypothetical protein GCM10023259_049760 [Thermocatellispora tengchongensis]